jgi:hypothetical protein
MVLKRFVGAAEGCDLLILFFKIKINRSQLSATPTVELFQDSQPCREQ